MFCVFFFFGGEDGHAETPAYSDVASIKSYKSIIFVIFSYRCSRKDKNEEKCKQSILNIV